MSSKSSNSNRQSSPRAMPVETIITRFKSAQQRRQLREMDRSMTKVTELLKNPLKPRVKKKIQAPCKDVLKSSNIIPTKEVEECQRTKKNNANNLERVEFCPLKMKRHIALNKISLKPRHELKVIARTNKRKRLMPTKGEFPQGSPKLSADSDCYNSSRDGSPKAKRLKHYTQDMDMVEMIQYIEDSDGLDDDDLLEILTCPSPVWWEDPPDGYIEDALFTRPRSTAEMYPSIRSQLQENLIERKRCNTPNVLSRREKTTSNRGAANIEDKSTDKEELSNNNCIIDVGVSLSKRDERFIKKRSKLESVLGNLKNKNLKTNDTVEKIMNVKSNFNDKNDSVPNKWSDILNSCSDQFNKGGEKLVNNVCNLERNTDKHRELKASVSSDTDYETTDDERLTDISFQDDDYLYDFENMNIPMQKNTELSKKELVNKKKSESSNLIPDPEITVPGFKAQTGKDTKAQNCTLGSIDPTFSGKKSSMIEEFLEMKMYERKYTIVNKKQNVYSKSELNTTPLKCAEDCTEMKTNLTTSVIKLKKSSMSSVNVFKIENVFKNLPPLKNSDSRTGNAGYEPKSLPPLRLNPVIKLSSKSYKNTTSFHTFGSNRSVLTQDYLDTIPDTNVAFLTEEDEGHGIAKKIANNKELKATSFIKPYRVETNKLRSDESNVTQNDELPSEDNDAPVNKLALTQKYKNLTQMNAAKGSECIDLESQSFTITKNDLSCCKLKDAKLDPVIIKKNDLVKHDELIHNEGLFIKTGDLTTFEPQSCVINELNTSVNDNNGENDFISNMTNPELNKDVQDMNSKKSSFQYKCDESFVTSDNNKDKMVFYFKKWKTTYWRDTKLKLDNLGDKKLANDKNELLANKTESSDPKSPTIDVHDIKSCKVGNTDRKKVTGGKNRKKKKGSKRSKKVNLKNNLTNPDANKEKCIIVSGSKQMRYCMKCSSIYDTATCNYCSKRNDSSVKYPSVTDYIFRVEKCFVCEVCGYKALSKDILDRHMLSHCGDSKKR